MREEPPSHTLPELASCDPYDIPQTQIMLGRQFFMGRILNPDINKFCHEVGFIRLSYSLSSSYNLPSSDQTGLTIPFFKVIIVELESIMVNNSIQISKMSCFKLPIFLFCSYLISYIPILFLFSSEIFPIFLFF